VAGLIERKVKAKVSGTKRLTGCADIDVNVSCAKCYKSAEAGVGKPRKPKGGWLFKEEPTHYSYSDLERDGTTLWDGVENNLARKHLRNVKPGDHALYYHTGNEKAVVAEMLVIGGPMPDPQSDDPKSVVVRVRPLKTWPRPVTLEEIKQEPLLADWELVRIPRLSVMPVTPDQWQRLEELAAKY
jgi:predicted RNA-binding protein with PUA-like domain